MEETESYLKEIIIKRYGSLKKFCEKIDMPWTTLDSILKRGVANSNITNIMKITKELHIDTESLAAGSIVDSPLINHNTIDTKNFNDINFLPVEQTLTAKDNREISSILANTEELLQQEGLMFDGEPASRESIDSILSAMKIGMEMAKKNNKKYTPNKYKKD